MSRKLYPSEIVRRLTAIGERWPDNLMLFANSTSLLLVDIETLEVKGEVCNINCDGGDTTSFEDDDGKEYLDL